MAKVLNNGTEPAVLRKLGINEKYQLAMYLLDQYRGTILSCRYTLPQHLALAESQTRLEEVVKVAVVDTIMRHPMLQVGMIDATSKTPSWIQLKSLDLKHHIQWLYLGKDIDFEHTVQETIRVQLDERFPELSTKQPDWKITVIWQAGAAVMEVLLTWNHPQFDGVGAKVFHEDLLEMLTSVDDRGYERPGLNEDILTLPEAPPCLPTPIESLKSLPLDLKYLARVYWDEIRPQFLNRDVSQATWCPIRSSPYKTQFRAFLIDNASLLAILALCRQNKTTITGLLNALALIAFSSRLDSAAAPAFQCSTVMDHRRNLPPAPPDAPWDRSDRAVSNYVTQVPHRFDTGLVGRIRSKLLANSSEGCDLLSTDLQRELWTVAAQNRREILQKLDDGLRNDLVGVFRHVTDWQKTMRDMAKRQRQFTWLISNIGVLAGNTSENAQEWSINRAQFGLSAEIPAAAIEFAPISVAGRGMCVSVNWPDCAVDLMLGERIMADLKS
ncbi:hypothetical protein BU24DRAFT_356555 [Aaosphaeria arxii CBS 175.79]|uniref:Alcohol acetyltransferase n=1 Tax=Aaosphaeria arxii CBS 175.79 TaxID=1450172 RepID=A0A6A5XCX6_9PLEO|nr:uncharacterized protein BU24DRAFT_356555 [Aaosphaeria arxii CBS 175.79]KAF2010624.1 hypothetical protein BU24DRAFT_356555 [Aaosphaeria arxii CBS 175.79]